MAKVGGKRLTTEVLRDLRDPKALPGLLRKMVGADAYSHDLIQHAADELEKLQRAEERRASQAGA